MVRQAQYTMDNIPRDPDGMRDMWEQDAKSVYTDGHATALHVKRHPSNDEWTPTPQGGR